ncbi:MAG: hypothetical protein AABY98_05560, partial [Candidatus Deferrimicrobiota bacterium]
EGKVCPLPTTHNPQTGGLRQRADDDASDTSHRGVFSAEGTAGVYLFKVKALSGDIPAKGGHSWFIPGRKGRSVLPLRQ